jgi:ABC-type nickel/cobalt efflux system permease component RcnA
VVKNLVLGALILALGVGIWASADTSDAASIVVGLLLTFVGAFLFWSSLFRLRFERLIRSQQHPPAG